jgi:ppGpp synthetase/RelA/SpoT-type nucleotidyltranferase
MIDIEILKNTYSQETKKYDALGKRLKTEFGRLLGKSKIHVITNRTKELDSLAGKIVSKDKYTHLNEITDLCGIRIITNLESDIEYVAELLKKNYKIDTQNSLDHRKREPNDFGYLSLHLVLELSEQKAALKKNKAIKGLKAEVQIRSILQHAWAEIEHDLGYKSEEDVPKEFQRGSNRLSAILEAADLEFVRLNTLKLNHYQEATKALSSPQENNTPIDGINISVVDSENKTLNEIRKMLTNKHGVTFIKKGNYQNILNKLSFFNITYLEDLEKRLITNKKSLIKFSDLLFERRNDNRRYILFEAPLEYFLHFLGSAHDIEQWNSYRGTNTPDCKSTIGEVVDFMQLHIDSLVE